MYPEMALLGDLISLTKPKITLLNIGSAISCFLLAGGGFEGAVFLFLIGYLASGGASVLNNYFDRDSDALMRRTRERPLPAMRLSARLAFAYGLLLSAASIVAATIIFNTLTALMIAAGIISYAVIYTLLLKRRTDWNIVLGGVAGSFPPLAGWAAATGSVGLEAALIALIIFLWTPGHFWSLAIRAESDYRAAGLPMLPVTRGLDRAVTSIAASNVLMLAGWAALSLTITSPLVFLVSTSPPTALVIYFTARLVRSRKREDSWRLFKASSPWLLLIQIGAPLTRIV